MEPLPELFIPDAALPPTSRGDCKQASASPGTHSLLSPFNSRKGGEGERAFLGYFLFSFLALCYCFP